MARVRPLQREDIPAVASLYERVMRSGNRTPPPHLAAYFERTLLDHPWADPEIPSLVHPAEDGGIAGFLGSHVRRLRFDGRPLRLGCSGQLVSDPAARHAAVGAVLLREYLRGPQDLSITDGATETVRRMWERLGGHTLYLSSLGWTRVLRPGSVFGERLAGGRAPRAANATATFVDALAERMPRGPFRVDEPTTRTEPLRAREVIGQLPDVAGWARLRPDYDEPFLEWLLRELAAVRARGELLGRMVRGSDGRALGWYLAYAGPDRVVTVIQLAAGERDVESVIDQLFFDAARRKAVAVEGRWEPHLFEPLSRRRGVILAHDARALVHSRHSEVTQAIALGEALLTRMEGEWWMGHHIERFE